MATHCGGATPRLRAAFKYGSGCGFPIPTSSPTMTALNVPGGSSATTSSANRRHDMVTSAQGTPTTCSAASSSRAPGIHRAAESEWECKLSSTRSRS